MHLHCEQLEDRVLPAVQAVFDAGVLTVTGDRFDNVIIVGADSGGNLVVTDNGVAVPIVGNSNASLAATNLIVIDGKGGDDVLLTDSSLNILDANGVLADAVNVVMRGGSGNDVLRVGHGGIVGGLAGVDADGNVVGQVVGNAWMDGGAGNDRLVSGFGNDVMFGGGGDDNYVWPPGTLTDVWDGGGGNDSVTIIGNSPGDDVFSLTADGTDLLFQRLNLIRFSVEISRTENVVLRPGDGDDTVLIGDLTGVKRIQSVVVIDDDGVKLI